MTPGLVVREATADDLAAEGGLHCRVEAIRTASGLRGRGIGAGLLAHVEAQARARGVARTQLTTNRERVDAHSLDEGLGFVGTHEGMKKDL